MQRYVLSAHLGPDDTLPSARRASLVPYYWYQAIFFASTENHSVPYPLVCNKLGARFLLNWFSYVKKDKLKNYLISRLEPYDTHPEVVV